MLEFAVLGPVEVRVNGEPIAIGGPRQRTLLSAMLCRPGQVLPASDLAEALWGEPGERFATNLQVNVHRLRRSLGDPARVEFRPPGYRLALEKHELDAAQFDELVARGRSEMALADAGRAVAAYDQALALWRGEAYSGLDDVDPIRTERDRLSERRNAAIESRLAALVAAGRAADAVHDLTVLAEADPYRESVVALQIEALRRTGRRAEALATYRRVHRLFRVDLGVEPGPDLTALHRTILAGADPARHVESEPVRRIESEPARRVESEPAESSSNRLASRAGQCLAGGDHASAIRLARQALRDAPEHAGASELIGTCLREQGRFDEAYTHFTVALTRAVSRDDVAAEARVLQLLAIVERERARHASAARLLRRAGGIHRDRGDQVHQACMLLSEGELRLRAGSPGAVHLISEGLQACEAMGLDFGVAYGSRLLGQAQLDAGRPGAALPLVTRAARLSRSSAGPFAFAVALLCLGRTHAALEHATDARRVWRRSAKLFDGIGYRAASLRVRHLLGGVT